MSLLHYLSVEHPSIVAQKKEIYIILEEFETGKNRSIAQQQSLEAKTQCLGVKLCNLERFFSKSKHELDKPLQEIWERRIGNLRRSVDDLHVALKTQINHIYRVRRDEKERRELLQVARLIDRKQSTSAMSAITAERFTLAESSQLLDSISQQGKAVVTNLLGQNVVLKSARKKLLDFRNVLGVSTSLIGTIERRHSTDRFIVYGCMLVTVVTFLDKNFFQRVVLVQLIFSNMQMNQWPGPPSNTSLLSETRAAETPRGKRSLMVSMVRYSDGSSSSVATRSSKKVARGVNSMYVSSASSSLDAVCPDTDIALPNTSQNEENSNPRPVYINTGVYHHVLRR